MTKKLIRPVLIIVGATALAGGFGSYVWQKEHRLPLLEVYVFNLSNGRSMFIRTPEDKRILIDGGSNSEIIRKISKIIPFYSRRIDTVIATNTEGKNVSGLIDVIERYDVDSVFIPKFTLENLNLQTLTDQTYSTFLEILSKKQIKTDELFIDQVIDLDNQTKLNIHFPAKPETFSYSKSSAPELLFTISNNKNNISFLGNSTKKIQKYIANSSPDLFNVDVLIFAQSIIPANVSSELIKKLNPANVIFSQRVSTTPPKLSTSSKNKKEVVDPLSYLKSENKFNIREKGTTKIVSDGRDVLIIYENSYK